MKTEQEKMLGGELYDPTDPALVAARARTRDSGRTQRSAGTTDIFNDDGAEQRPHLLSPRATEGVERTTRRKRNHEPDWPRRIILRDGGVRDGWERDGTRR
jgi:hypothetical protein